MERGWCRHELSHAPVPLARGSLDCVQRWHHPVRRPPWSSPFEALRFCCPCSRRPDCLHADDLGTICSARGAVADSERADDERLSAEPADCFAAHGYAFAEGRQSVHAQTHCGDVLPAVRRESPAVQHHDAGHGHRYEADAEPVSTHQDHDQLGQRRRTACSCAELPDRRGRQSFRRSPLHHLRHGDRHAARGLCRHRRRRPLQCAGLPALGHHEEPAG